MSNLSLLLKEGAAALKQGNYTTAIASLKEFCESPVPAESKAYLQGHKWLVQAYVKEKETELALEICLKMAESQAPEAEQWATQAIPKLQQAIAQQQETQPSENGDAAPSATASTPAPSDPCQVPTDQSALPNPVLPNPDRPADPDSPADQNSPADGAQAVEDSAPAPERSPEEIKQAIDQAVKAFRRGAHGEVIEQLEPLSSSLDPQSSNYGRAQMTLAKAYKAESETEKAIALAQTLMASDRDDISIWGKQFLNNLGAGAIADSPTHAAEEVASPATDAPESSEDFANSFSPSDSSPPHSSSSSISGIPYQAPRGASNGALSPTHSSPTHSSPTHSSPTRSPQVVSQRDPNDYTPVIQSAMSHGSVTFIVSWLMYWLFPYSLAFCFDMLRFAVPIIIYCTATDPIAKINAKEATNYVITTLLIMVMAFGGGIFLGIGAMALGLLMGPLIVLLAIPLVVYCLVLAFYPVVGTIMCLANPDKTFHYPRWLIWHAI